MKLKKAAAVLCSALIMLAAGAVPFTAHAVKGTSVYENGDIFDDNTTTAQVTTIPQTTAPVTNATTIPTTRQPATKTTPKATTPTPTTTAPTTTTSQTTTTLPEDATSAAANISLEIGKVSNGIFSADLKIDSEANIKNATILIKYSADKIQYLKSSHNTDIGGEFNATTNKGKIKYTYSNSDSTDFDGTFSTLQFKVKDEQMKSTVIYLEVKELKNELGQNVAHNESNGIVHNNEYVAVTTTAKPENYAPLTVKLSQSPVTLESLGIRDAVSCDVEDTDIMTYSSNKLTLLTAGKSRMTVIYKDGKKGYFEVTVKDDSTISQNDSNNSLGTRENVSNKNNIWIFIVLILVAIAAIAICLIIYFTTVKPKKIKPIHMDDDEEFDELNLDDNDSEENDTYNDDNDED